MKRILLRENEQEILSIIINSCFKLIIYVVISVCVKQTAKFYDDYVHLDLLSGTLVPSTINK